jgi:FkbM family methyltransferase
MDTVGQRIFWTGFREWESETVPIFLALLRESRSFVDVGANCGIYTVLACGINPTIHVVAVEPVPQLFGALKNNVRRGNLAGRVQLVQAALSTSRGVAKFHQSVDPTMGSLNTAGYRGKAGTIIEVKTTTLDALVSKLAVAPDLIKIDVEGFEDAVLEGGRTTLEKARPTFIVEANSDGPFVKLNEIFSRYGYSFHHLNEAGVTRRDALIPHPSDHCCNWLVLPPGKQAPTCQSFRPRLHMSRSEHAPTVESALKS